MGKLLGTAIAEIRLPVADNQLQFLVAQGQLAKVNLTGTYAGKDVQWQARIVRSEGVVDDKSRMSYLVAEVQDPYQLQSTEEENNTMLRFGAYVQAKILGVEIASASVVPRYLVVNDRIAILDDESKLHYADIDIIRQQGGDVIVANGLIDGDKLIVSALDYPVEGMKLALAGDDNKDQDTTDDSSNEKVETQVASTESEGE